MIAFNRFGGHFCKHQACVFFRSRIQKSVPRFFQQIKGLRFGTICTGMADVFMELMVVWAFVYLFPSSMVMASGGEWDLKLGQNIVFICELRPWHFIFGATAALNMIYQGTQITWLTLKYKIAVNFFPGDFIWLACGESRAICQKLSYMCSKCLCTSMI